MKGKLNLLLPIVNWDVVFLETFHSERTTWLNAFLIEITTNPSNSMIKSYEIIHSMMSFIHISFSLPLHIHSLHHFYSFNCSFLPYMSFMCNTYTKVVDFPCFNDYLEYIFWFPKLLFQRMDLMKYIIIILSNLY